MKQPKKLTRNQKELLVKKGMSQMTICSIQRMRKRMILYKQEGKETGRQSKSKQEV